ncbi:hypothetical protein [Streptomyces sp. AP-93]|uniref:hypothetical protein n=1 Tax=Streptomyces sp. AP-93 TaxID=2929048 RepID=UPI001FB0398A|nr:hypothetical protein [Streptomyces sp. AP-93]MCJ0868915.1 hypothetical protein [Streptomyces sp. AP-93]
MTETTVEPQAPPQEATTSPAPTEPTATAKAKEVEHTPGGFPVGPLSLTGTNTAAGLLATAALVGGPIAAAIAMTGAAVLGTAAAHQRSKDRKKKPAAKPTPAANRTAGGKQGRSTLGRIPSQPRTSARTGGGSGSPRRAGGGQARHRAAAAAGVRSAGRSGASFNKAGKPSARQRAGQAVGRLAGGRAGQVRDLRSQAKTQAPTRSAARTAAVQARRQVADTRRAAKAAARATSTGTKARGPAARTLAKSMGKAAAVRDKAVGAVRSLRDRGAGRAVANGRAGVQDKAFRKRVKQLAAPARKATRKALRKSAARFHARRAMAGVLGALLGAIGLLTTPLGRKLGWAWLQNPGRRLYRRLLARAEDERHERDLGIAAQHDADMEEVLAEARTEQEAEGDLLGDRAARPTTHVPAPPVSQGVAVSNASGFRFEELAAEMEQAAQAYEPENAMEILAMIEGLPEALASIANVMQILAERSDTEFPLEKEVADGFADIYGAINSAVAVAEDLGPAFRKAHEADIARHEDPRNGPEAEKGWNV